VLNLAEYCSQSQLFSTKRAASGKHRPRVFLLGGVSRLRQLHATNETRFFASVFPRPRGPEYADEPICEGTGGRNLPPIATSAVNNRGLEALAGEPPKLKRVAMPDKPIMPKLRVSN
jgi:hypothetical protein